MLTIRNRLFSTYSKVPLFYKLYFVTSGITYCYFPQTQTTILVNTCSLLVADTVQYLEDYVKHVYPDKLLLCDVVFFTNIISKIGALGYVSNQLQILKGMHGSLVGIGYGINSYLLNATINSAYYSAVWGTVSSFSMWCGFKTFKHMIDPAIKDLMTGIQQQYRQLITELQNPTNPELKVLITTITNLLTNQNLISLMNMGQNKSGKKVFTVEELDKIAPTRCIGLKRHIPIFKTTCAVCQDECTHKQLHRVLPCKHTFHTHCIDNWLLEKTTVCPMCRRDAST
jgi:hypothetical protein